MKSPTMRTTLAVELLLLSTVNALPEISLGKKSWTELGDAIPQSLLRKRASGSGYLSTNPYQILTYSNGGAYYMNVTVGTPPQPQVLILDTGSSDLYFDASDADACETTGDHSCRGGTFNKGQSSTYKEVQKSPAFNSSFGDGSDAIGPYGTDVVAIGDVVLSNLQFGVAEQTNSTAGYALGLIGIGYSYGEATQDVYPNVVDVFAETGVTNSRLYSLYLGDSVYGSGNILFGGIDTAKFTGSMTTFNCLPDYYTGLVDRFITTVTDLQVTVGGKSSSIWSGGSDSISAYTSSNHAAIALLDSGSAAWTVPSTYYDAIVEAFTYVDSDGNCPCSHRWSGDSLLLTFGGKQQIKVTAQEFIVPLFDESTNKPYTDSHGNQLCTFLIGPSAPHEELLTAGDAVLRSMYVVYDLDNGQVSIAQAAPNATDSKPTAVPAGPGGVASVVSGVATLRATSSLIAPIVSATINVGVSTAASTVGVATGADAVPTAARTAGSTTGTGSGSGSGSSQSSTAGSGATSLSFSWGNIISIGWMLCMGMAGATLLI